MTTREQGKINGRKAGLASAARRRKKFKPLSDTPVSLSSVNEACEVLRRVAVATGQEYVSVSVFPDGKVEIVGWNRGGNGWTQHANISHASIGVELQPANALAVELAFVEDPIEGTIP